MNISAAAFVPGQFSSSSKQSSSLTAAQNIHEPYTYNPYSCSIPIPETQSSSKIIEIDDFCPEHAESGYCSYSSVEDQSIKCPYKKHGDQCPICTLWVIDKNNPNDKHMLNCNAEHEQEILENCKIQDSEKMVCSVCMEIVWEIPNKSQRRFGILENCDHVFCLACIREWRCNNSADKTATKGCPTCRKASNFIIPSKYFITDPVEKSNLIEQYKNNLSGQHCKYFKKGKGDCPFGISCFYKHQYESGELQDRDPEKWRKSRYNIDGKRVLQDQDHWLGFFWSKKKLLNSLEGLLKKIFFSKPKKTSPLPTPSTKFSQNSSTASTSPKTRSSATAKSTMIS